MNPKQLLIIVPALFVLNLGTANAGKTLEEAGALVCVTDKWDEKELEKGHKLADAVMRCVAVPDSPDLDRYAQACTGKYEYMPDGTGRAPGRARIATRAGTRVTRPLRRGLI